MSLWVLWCGLLPLAMIDAKHMLLPDCLTQALLWEPAESCAFHTLPCRCRSVVAVASLLGLSPDNRTRGLGYGDFKLLAALGAWCGWQALPSLLLLAAALSGIALYFVFIKRLKK